MLLRSLMFVPGHQPRMVERALGLAEFTPSALDVAILDLEDGVPEAEKERARAGIAAALGRLPNGEGPARFVRINRDRAARDADLQAVMRSGLHGIVAPKVDHPDEIAELSRELDDREDAAGLTRGAIGLIASIESARGLLDARAIASPDRVIALLFGAEDFARDLALPTEREAEAAELIYPRSGIVVAAVAANKSAIDGIWPNVTDSDGLRRDALQGRRLGFVGKSLIHPAQIETVNEVFSPSAAEVSYAERVVGAFDRAQTKGEGATALDGKMLDQPIVERARRTLLQNEAVTRKQRTPPVERPAALEGKRFK